MRSGDIDAGWWSIAMKLNLEGKCAVITGAARGVGRGIAIALADEKVNIAINYYSSANAAGALVQELTEKGVRAVAIQADLSSAADCARLMDEAAEKLGKLDILVNNAGVWPKSWLQDMSLEEWNRTMDVNLTSVFLTSQAFLRKAIAGNRGGKVLNITSQAAFHGSTTGHAHYAASKAGVVSLTVSMARECAKYKINVNAMALGMVETDMTKNALEKNREYYLQRIPIGRIATPADIGPIVAFMVSDAAAYITGATIDATGGMLMR